MSMKVCQTCKVEKDLSEFHLRVTGRDGHSNYCKQCYNVQQAKCKVKYRAQAKEWRQKHCEQRHIYRVEYYLKNHRRWKEWYQEHYEHYHESVARRRASKLHATPPWVDKKELQKIYAEAFRRRWAGEDVHVDHIIPLKGEGVCGLHVPWNLQIIPANENLRKHNSYNKR